MKTLYRFVAVALLLLLLPSQNALAQLQNNPSADGVLGQTDFTSDASGLSDSKFTGPNGVAVDTTSGKVFVTDRGNHRVLRFSSSAALQNGAAAEAVFGQDDFTTNASGTAANRMNNPIGIHVDGDGRLWVTDFSNNRVLRFDDASNKTSGAAADGVLGQPDFTSSASGTSATEMRGPVTAFADGDGNLWVTEFSNHRVTRFDDAADKANGAAADGVLGQPDFTTGDSGLSASALRSPNASYVDDAGNLYVSDNGNYRVMRFDAAANKADGADADGVLGQPDFDTRESNVTQAGMTSLRYVFGDDEGRLYVIQEGSHRITIYNDAATLANGAPADYVWGQPDFTTGDRTSPPTASGFNTPRAIYVDDTEDRVWVADYSNHRVLRFDLLPTGETALVLAAPNGGESLSYGTTFTIQWSSQNVDEVAIDYSTDDGATWTAIDTVSADAGQYDWVVPEAVTAEGRVRIYDPTDATVEDISEAAFSIVEPEELVTLISPNGYQEWVSGMNRQILFTAKDVTSVDLSYSLDNGSTWTSIVEGYAVSEGAYTWTLPEATSTAALVQITKAGDDSVSDMSDAPFMIVAEARGERQDIIFFAGSPVGGYYDASYAFDTDPSTVENQNTKLPLTADYALIDNYALRLSWMSGTGGDWGAAIASPGWPGHDVTTQETFMFSAFSETALSQDELPVIYLEDLSNSKSDKLQLSAYSDAWEANTWNQVSIPVEAFTSNAGTADMTRIKTIFFGQNAADGTQHTVYLDDIRMTGGEIISGEDRPVIVVLGSSTAAGTGSSTPDSSWVGRYRKYVMEQNADARVVNLAIGGYTTYHIMPTGYVPPSGRPTPRPNNNITRALEYDPTVIIVNLPSNDANIGVPVEDQMDNFRTIQAAAAAEGVPIWFSTTQPRNFTDEAKRQNLMAARDSIIAAFEPQVLDFWTGLATETGMLESQYDSGDGIHLNDMGHKLLYERVVAANVWTDVSVDNEGSSVSTLALEQNYPNPFGPETVIRFSLPTSTAHASLDVYDLLGRHVTSLVDKPLEAGPHTVRFDGSALASGVYVYRLEAAGQVLVRRMTVVR